MAGSASVGGRGGAEASASSSNSDGDRGVFGGAIGGGGGGESFSLLPEKLRELISDAEDPTARATVEKGLRCGEPTKLTKEALSIG